MATHAIYADVKHEDQRRIGISPAMVRLPIGVEHPEDLIADLKEVLHHV